MPPFYYDRKGLGEGANCSAHFGRCILNYYVGAECLCITAQVGAHVNSLFIVISM
jgi:hypothetical protein